MTETGSFSLGTGNAIDLLYRTVVVQPLTKDGVDYLNTLQFCGSTAWRDGDTRDVASLSGQLNCWNRVPREVFDIYAVEGRNLYFGLGEDPLKLAESSRPKDLDRKTIFVRN